MTMLQRRIILICWLRRDYTTPVQYWEPAKWVAKLRELKTDDRLLLLCTDMDSGHGGKSGRFKSYEGVAMEYAFLIGLAQGTLHGQASAQALSR